MTQRTIPDSNVLDLRQPATPPPTQRGWRVKRPRPVEEKKESRPPRDWRSWRRESNKFFMAGLLVIIPGAIILSGGSLYQASQKVSAEASTGGRALQRGAQAMTSWNQDQATTEFQTAAETFGAARTNLHRALGWSGFFWRRVPIAGRKIRSAEAALMAGQRLAETASQATELLRGTPKPQSIEITNDGVLRGSLGFLAPLMTQSEAFRPILLDLSQASQALLDVDPRDVPERYRSGIEVWKRLHPVFFGSDQRMVHVYDLLAELFGSQQAREFLVLFENDDELRATGGFPGTFLLIKFQAGTFAILDSPVTGPYDITAQVPKTILPPQPILSIAPYWSFQDATWFLDAPTSSKFVLDFYERARGFRPQGVFHVTPSLIEDLLRITGPIRPPGYGLSIDANNFLRATELQVEFGYDKALNNPKEFLLDLMPVLFDRLGKLSSPQALQALITFFDHAGQSNFLVTSEVPEIADTAKGLHWDGRIADAPDDYLAVVDSNLGGGKTDRVLEEKVQVQVEPDGGRLKHTVKIHRHHNGKTGDILTGQTSRAFIRVYVPKDAILISVRGATKPPDGFFQAPQRGALPDDDLRKAEGTVLAEEGDRLRITEETGKKVFGFWSIIAPGKSQDLTVTYTTPTYSPWNLIWQKQPGTIRRSWELSFQSPKSIRSATPASGITKSTKREITWKTNSEVTREFTVKY